MAAGGATKRGLRMATMSAGVAGSYLGYLLQSRFLGQEARGKKLKAVHRKTGRRMADEFLLMRGPAMKLGQALSLQTDLLPEETLAELSTLQMRAPGMHPSLARAQFRASMGRNPEHVFKSFESEPFAAASLGQVHRAVTKEGQRVAVKIQYPGIRDAIENDFKWFRAVAQPVQLLKYMPTDAIDELQKEINAETDYEREAKNATVFEKGLALLPYVHVPKIFERYSSDKVLTMSLMGGKHLDDFLASRPSQSLRDLVGTRLLDLFYFQLLEMGVLHADPHWGNYLFRPSGAIGLIDFGCVKYFPAAFIENLRAVYLYQGDRQSPEFSRLLEHRYARRGQRLSPATRQAFMSVAQNFYARVYPPRPETDDRAFAFDDSSFLTDYIRETSKIIRAKGMLPEYVFLARAELGLYQTLHRLGSRVRTSATVRKYLNPSSEPTKKAHLTTSL